MGDDKVDGFVLHVSFDGPARRPVVAVHGEIDLVTAPSLAGVLNAMIDDGHHELVVDLAELTFVDAQGLNVLALVAQRVAELGGALILRSTPAHALRIFDLTHVSDVFAYEDPPPAALRPAQAPTSAAQARDSETRRPYEPTRSSIDAIDAALRLVTMLAGATLRNADGVSVTLERNGQPMTVAATDDTVLTMDRHQYEAGEGPCLAAQAEGRWFYIDSLEDETRWPNYVPLAIGHGIHSVLSSPLKGNDRPAGSLNIYSASRQAFGTSEQELATIFAEHASAILDAADENPTPLESNQRFFQALAARQIIHQAQGMIMARHDLDANSAIRSLFQQARAARITVLDHSTEIVASHTAGGPV